MLVCYNNKMTIKEVGKSLEMIKLTLRWRCANLMRFITLQVALFSSNAILYRRAPVCIVFVYRYTSIIASFSHEVLANVEQRARPA